MFEGQFLTAPDLVQYYFHSIQTIAFFIELNHVHIASETTTGIERAVLDQFNRLSATRAGFNN